MPRIRYSQQHSLETEEARRRLQRLMDRFGQRFGFRTSWVGTRAADVKGRGVSGSMTLGDGEVLIDLNISLLLTPFKSRIEQGIASQVEQALGPRSPG